jgi:hypothetical protein
MRYSYGLRSLSGLHVLVLLRTSAATTVFVSNSSTSSNTTSLGAAFKDPAVTKIVIRDDYYSVGEFFAPHMPGHGSGAVNVTRYAAGVGSSRSRSRSSCRHLLQQVSA